MKLRLVPASTGRLWVREGLSAFRKQPMAFVSLFMLFSGAVMLLSLLPVVGDVLAVMLGPAMTLAIMAATEQVAHAPAQAPAGASPALRPSAMLFAAALAAVRKSARALAQLGLLYALLVLGLGALATLVAGNPFAEAFTADGTPRPEVFQTARFQVGVLVRMLFYLPAALAFWHAPALVHWHQVSGVKSLFFSLVACWRNMAALTVFGLIWAALVLAATLVLGVLSLMLSAVTGPLALGAALMMGGSLVLSAAFLASTWFTFRDSFDAG